MRSLASADTLEKCSLGKLKSHLRMLDVVSSSLSSRKGDRPLKSSETDDFILRIFTAPVNRQF